MSDNEKITDKFKKSILELSENDKALFIVIKEGRIDFHSKGLSYLERLGLLHECTIGDMKGRILDTANENINEIKKIIEEEINNE